MLLPPHSPRGPPASHQHSTNHEIHRRINKSASSPRLAVLLNQTVQYVPLRFFGTIEGWSQASGAAQKIVAERPSFHPQGTT